MNRSVTYKVESHFSFKPLDIPRPSVSLWDHGGMPEHLPITIIEAFKRCLQELKELGGGTLVIPPGQYHLGNHSLAEPILTLEGLSHIRISGYGATLTTNSFDEVTPVFFRIKGSQNLSVLGLTFIDFGSSLANDRKGAIAIELDTSCPSEHIQIEDCHAHNCQALFKSYTEGDRFVQPSTGLIVRGSVSNCYFGAILHRSVRFSQFELKTTRVRRAFVGHGVQDLDLAIDAEVVGGVGSNALCELFSGGQCLPVSHVKIKVRATGNLAWHNSLVSFLHHGSKSQPSYFNDVEAQIEIKKAPSLPECALFQFSQLNSGRILEKTTNRNWNRVYLNTMVDEETASLLAQSNKVIQCSTHSLLGENSILLDPRTRMYQDLASLPSYVTWGDLQTVSSELERISA